MIAAPLLLAVILGLGLITFITSLEWANPSPYGQRLPGGIPTFFGMVTASLILWFTISYHLPVVEREVKTFTVSTIENLDVIVDGSEVKNLNKEFDRDFEPGDKVYRKEGVWSGGLWWPSYLSLEE